MPDTIRYQTTGALLPGSALYVRRTADDQLAQGLLAGEFCYVLSARQMGKSSLLAETVTKLRAHGRMVATANLQAGTDVKSENEWYEGLIEQLVDTAAQNPDFVMPFQWGPWWDAQRGPLGQRFAKFVREAFLASNESNWIVAVDEIDATITLPFTDSFFAAIRLCYDNRPGQVAFRRLAFALFGVATPTELIKARSRTPFNIGRAIELTGFTASEAAPLAAGLGGDPALRAKTLERILYWTGGHPHLTQNLCEKLASEWECSDGLLNSDEVVERVDALVSATYFHGNVFKEPHFAYIAEQRVDRYKQKAGLLRVLAECRKENGCDPAGVAAKVAELKIAGLAVTSPDGRFRISNPIYHRIFDEAWIAAHMPANAWRNTAIASISLGVCGWLVWFLWVAPLLKQWEEIRAYAVKILEATIVVPRQEYQQLSKFTDEQISRSLRSARGKPGTESVAKLSAYASESQIAVKLWTDYWRTQSKAMLRLVEHLSSLSTRSDVDAQKVELQFTARRLRDGLTETNAIQNIIRADAGKSMSLAVSVLWNPIELGDSIQRNNDVTSVATAKWIALADALGKLTPLVDAAELSERIFPRLVLGIGNERQRVSRSDEAAQKVLDGMVKQMPNPGPSRFGRSGTISDARSQAQLDALSRITKGAPNDACHSLAVIISDALENTAETDLDRLPSLAEALRPLAQKMEANEAGPLAERLTKALENPQETDAGRLSSLAEALGVLTLKLGAQDAAMLAERLIKTLENTERMESDRLSGFALALAALVQKMDVKESAPLAARGAGVFTKALENQQETNPSRLSNLALVLGALVQRMGTQEAALLAERLIKTLENTEGMEADRLSSFASVLGAVAQKVDANEAALTARGAGVLTEALENLQETESYSFSRLASALGVLAHNMDAEKAAPLAARGAAVLTKTLENPQETDYARLSGLVSALGTLTQSLGPKETAPLAEGLIKELENPRETIPSRLSSLASALETLANKMEAKETLPLAKRGAGVLIKALEDLPQTDSPVLWNFAPELGALVQRMDTQEAALLAVRLIKAMENPRDTNSDRLSNLASALGVLAQKLEAEEAAPLAARGAVALIKTMENTQETDRSRLSRLRKAQVTLTQKMDARDAIPVVKRTVNFLIPRVSDASSEPVLWILVLWAQYPSAVEPTQIATVTSWLNSNTTGSDGIRDESRYLGLFWLLLSLAAPALNSRQYATQGTKFLIQSLREKDAFDTSLRNLREELPSVLGENATAALNSRLIQSLEREATSISGDHELSTRMIAELRKPAAVKSP